MSSPELQPSPAPEPPAPRLIPCPSCDYPLAPGVSRCSECGYQCAADESIASIRRETFLQLTRGAWIAPVGLCAMLSLVTPFFVPLFFLVLYLAATGLVGAKLTGAYRRILRRVWLVALPWLLLPWTALLAGISIVPEFVLGWRYSSDVPAFLHLSGRGAFGGLLLSLGVLAFNAVCWWIWRWRWRAMCHSAGIPAEMQRSRAAIGAARLAFIPACILAFCLLVTLGVSNILDFLVPGWDIG